MRHRAWRPTTTRAGKAMFGMVGVFAEFERSMIVARVNAGLARARAGGPKGGWQFAKVRGINPRPAVLGL